MASGVGGALSGEPKKQEDVIVTVAAIKPSSAPGMTSTKKGAAETSVAYPQSADAPPCDPAPAGLVSDAAPADDPASQAKGSKVIPRRGTLLTPSWLGVNNFDLSEMVRSPREAFGSSAGVFMKGLLTSLVVIATMLFVLVAIFFLIRTTTPKVKDGFCVTDDCLFHASLLKDTRGTKFDPCNDFSAHVCFNWSPPKQREDIRDFGTSAMVDMVYSWLLDLSTTLQEGSKAFPVANKALAMLESCMSNASTYGTDLKNFREFLNNLSLPWPNPPRQDVDALGVLVNLAYNWQAPFWFEVSVSLVRKGAFKGRRSIILAPAPLITLYRQQHRAVIREGKDAYFKYWMHFYVALFGDAKSANKKRALQTADMEGDIFDTIYEALYVSPKYSAVFLIEDLEMYTAHINSRRWLQQLQGGTALNPKLTDQDVVVTTNAHFLKTVAILFNRYTNDDILDFLGWQFAQHYTPVSDSGLLVARYGDRRTARSLRPAFCGFHFHIEVPYKVFLLSLRFASRLTQSDKELVDAGFDRLVSTAVYLVNDSTWLDSESRALATDKLRAASLRLRPPAKFLNDTNMEELFQAFPEKKTAFWRILHKIAPELSNDQ
ncbi:hypothetical protein V5799_031448 [Amblyomma americanum]|uniref:Peptidase M13 N-terminal domain-containing protein n=1 Tax=Amblyomma americanum TaxID=6943 RepID=A0AAQ4EKE5_AMBAM